MPRIVYEAAMPEKLPFNSSPIGKARDLLPRNWIVLSWIFPICNPASREGGFDEEIEVHGHAESLTGELIEQGEHIVVPEVAELVVNKIDAPDVGDKLRYQPKQALISLRRLTNICSRLSKCGPGCRDRLSIVLCQ